MFTPTEKKVRNYRRTLKQHCKKKTTRSGDTVECRLSIADLETMLEDAGISIWQVGRDKGSYQLGRHGDDGHYEYSNCRFITLEQNIKERDSSNCGNRSVRSASERKQMSLSTSKTWTKERREEFSRIRTGIKYKV